MKVALNSIILTTMSEQNNQTSKNMENKGTAVNIVL